MFWKISYIVVAISVLCAGVAFCASLTGANPYSSCSGNDIARTAGTKITKEQCSLFDDSTSSQETLPNLFDVAAKDTFISRSSLPVSQFNVQDLVWITSNGAFGYDQQGGVRSSNAPMMVVTASTEDAFDIDSPSGILMIVTSFLAFAGYILERIITARRSPYGRL